MQFKTGKTVLAGVLLSGVLWAPGLLHAQTNTPTTSTAQGQNLPKGIRDAKGVVPMLHENGWFISAEKMPDGSFAYCQMMNPYYQVQQTVIFSISLFEGEQALLVVVNPGVGESSAASGDAKNMKVSISFDGKKALTVPAVYDGQVLRAEIPDWKTFRTSFLSAQNILLQNGGRKKAFQLYGVPDAVRVLEQCSQQRALPAPTAQPEVIDVEEMKKRHTPAQPEPLKPNPTGEMRKDMP